MRVECINKAANGNIKPTGLVARKKDNNFSKPVQMEDGEELAKRSLACFKTAGIFLCLFAMVSCNLTKAIMSRARLQL